MNDENKDLGPMAPIGPAPDPDDDELYEAVPNAEAPTNIKEMLEQDREASQGRGVLRINDLARRFAPNMRSRAIQYLDAESDQKGVVGKIFSYLREELAGPKQVCTDAELKEIEALHRQISPTKVLAIPPQLGYELASEALNLSTRLVKKYGLDRASGFPIVAEVEMLSELAFHAAAETERWLQARGYKMSFKRWLKKGKPNLGMIAQHKVGITSVVGNTFEHRDREGYLLDEKGQRYPDLRR